MSIGKRVTEALEKMEKNDAEGALLPISSALDATATKYFRRGGRKSYKDFICQNIGLIIRVGFHPGFDPTKWWFKFDDPDFEYLKTGPLDSCSIQDILYHVVRCGLAHSAELPPSLKFIDERSFEAKDGILHMPASLIHGLIAAVVLCPENTDQTVPDNHILDVRGLPIKLNDLWGKKIEFEELLAAMFAAEGQECVKVWEQFVSSLA